MRHLILVRLRRCRVVHRHIRFVPVLRSNVPRLIQQLTRGNMEDDSLVNPLFRRQVSRVDTLTLCRRMEATRDRQFLPSIIIIIHNRGHLVGATAVHRQDFVPGVPRLLVRTDTRGI